MGAGKRPCYDLIVIGGGHAGCEAACIAAKIGAKTLLITASEDNLGQMSCNPAIGGIGKGILVKEIDALGGIMGSATDKAGIHFKVLNRSKGFAVWGPRAQADREQYRKAIRASVLNQKNLQMLTTLAEDLLVEDGKVKGVRTIDGEILIAGKVILTAGTFLNGEIVVGQQKWSGGRMGEKATSGMVATLKAHGFKVRRLKTGTPPRLDGNTINWEILDQQPGDSEPMFFAHGTKDYNLPQISCHITHTNAKTHEIVSQNMHQSGGHTVLTCNGPRYCPSIETKVLKFPEKVSHQIFLEPEGLNTSVIYPNGLANSLPLQVQQELINSIQGLEKTTIIKPGHCVGYDHFDPTELFTSLETKRIKGLYLAGQINGTTGYEEAAGQGILAGINAVASKPLELNRYNSYIGVMIDDLTAVGVDNEPYRMFTSRAENRLSIRCDNADERILPMAYALGTIDEDRYQDLKRRCKEMEDLEEALKAKRMTPHELTNMGLITKQDGNRRSLWEISHSTAYEKMAVIFPALKDFSEHAYSRVRVLSMYEPYLKKQKDAIKMLNEQEPTPISPELDYNSVHGLSNEAREKLSRLRPQSINVAKKIPGITPSAITALIIHLKKATDSVNVRAPQGKPEPQDAL